MTNFPRVGVGFIIKNEQGKILMLKRKGSHAEGTWALLGGHLDFMETIETCVKRETLEEANINVKNIEILGITEDFYKEENKHYITIITKAEYENGELKIMEPHKCTDMLWVSLDDLPENLMLSTKNVFEKLNYKI